MPWNYDDDEINGIVDSNIKDSPPNPPAVNSASTVRALLKSFWGAIRGQVSGGIDGMDEMKSEMLTTFENTLATLSLRDGIGTYDASTGIATIRNTAGADVTFTPVAAPNQANGKYFDIVKPGNRSITGTAVNMEAHGVLISRGAKWDYLPPSEVATMLNGARVDSGGVLKGAYIPVVSWQHPRGEAEMVGTNNYTTKGASFFQAMTERTIFNCIEIPFWVAGNTGSIEVRVYKGVTNRLTPSLLTLLDSQIIPFSNFNQIVGGLATIALSNTVYADAGESVCVFLHAGSGSVSFRFNNTVSSAPARNLFGHTTSLTPWTITWTTANDGYYSASFRLSLKDRATEIKVAGKLDASRVGAMSVNSSGVISGAYVPAISYQHPRGAAELVGSGNYGTKGGSTYQQLTDNTIFNAVDVPFWVVGNTGTVAVRIYKGSAARSNPTLLTLLYSVDIPFANFNQVVGSVMTIILPEAIMVEAGQSVCVFLHGGNEGIRWRFWSSQETSPVRNPFVYNESAVNIWDVNWAVGSSGYYSASLRLRIADPLVTAELKNLNDKVNAPVVETRRPTLPSKLYAVVGKETNFYFDQLALVKDAGLHGPTDCTISIECTVGIGYDRYWQIVATAGQIGSWPLTLRIFNIKGDLIETKTATLIVVANTAPSTQKNIVVVGDSTTDSSTGGVNGRVTLALADRFAGLTPVGGLSPKLYGLRGNEPGKHEGHSSWEWRHFTGAGLSNPAPAGNPFWNTATSQIDIADYKTKIGLSSTLHGVLFGLGINDAWAGGGYLPDSVIQTWVINVAKTLIDAFLANNPDMIVIIDLPLTDKSVNWTIPPIKKEVFRRNIWRIREMLLENFDHVAYHANVHIGQSALTVDRYWGYPQITKAVAEGYTETEIQIRDNVHPRMEGYNQRGRGMFAQWMGLLQ